MEQLRFEEFYETYYEKVYKYILKKTADFHLSEDLTMDVFTSCCQHFAHYDPQKASYGTWVFAAANNRLKNYYRDRKDLAELNEQSAVSGDMEDDVIRAQHVAFLRPRRLKPFLTTAGFPISRKSSTRRRNRPDALQRKAL